MSASGDHPRSREERNTSTGPTSLPPAQAQYDPFRPPTWTTPGVYDPFAPYTPPRNSPGGGELLQGPHPLGGLGLDYPSVSTHIEQRFPHAAASSSSPYQPIADHLSYSTPRDPPPRTAPDDSSIGIRRNSQEGYAYWNDSPPTRSYSEYDVEASSSRASDTASATQRYHESTRRRRHYNPDEFNGPSQRLPLPLPQQDQSRAGVPPLLPVHLTIEEQDDVVQRANNILSQCAFHFVAKYQFPIPVEREKPRVLRPSDREWTEWAYLLKRLATKRRIPARILFDNQIKQLVTTLENSIVVRQSTNSRAEQPAPRQPRDDHYMLQLVSAGLQVAKILKDSMAMEQLIQLYSRTEAVILRRRSRTSSSGGGRGTGAGGDSISSSPGRGVGGGGGSGSDSRGVVGAGRSSHGSRASVGVRGVGGSGRAGY